MYSGHRCTEVSLSNLEDSVTDLPLAKSFTIQKVLLTFTGVIMQLYLSSYFIWSLASLDGHFQLYGGH
jgi:hypothetical protein